MSSLLICPVVKLLKPNKIINIVIMSLTDLRKDYNSKSNVFLEENIVVKDPYDLFEKWFQDVLADKSIIEPNAMALSTSTKDGKPSCRYVLCKGYGKDGFTFFTHYTSRKGQELEDNPHAALTFFWPSMSKSVRIEGLVDKLPFSNADDYFQKRPYQSQIGALCSDQSKPISGRDVLENKAKELKEKYGEKEVPRPSQWGGYIVMPKSIEFWQGQTDRIHDRIKFRIPSEGEKADGILTHQGQNGWIYERLCP